ncbi:MAG: DNA/RNA nuclease SfsA [Proteobacteria bacterium]|nr:DNA/RNA nuclease SfsA [Pseudomonadota bacterium]
MQFPDPLIRGRLIKRYKRFLSDHEIDGGAVVVAHCANPGAMLGLQEPGSEVWLSPSRNPARKLKYSWELLRVDGSLVGINTALPNAIVAEAIEAGKIPELTGYESLRREVKYGKNSRIDILLEAPGKPPCYVEIKNVHLKRNNRAEFPDSVTARGTKHLVEMADMTAAGARAVMVYLVQREDCDSFAIAGDIDPVYAENLERARTAGVEAICYSCKLTLQSITLDRALPIQLDELP